MGSFFFWVRTSKSFKAKCVFCEKTRFTVMLGLQDHNLEVELARRSLEPR